MACKNKNKKGIELAIKHCQFIKEFHPNADPYYRWTENDTLVTLTKKEFENFLDEVLGECHI